MKKYYYLQLFFLLLGTSLCADPVIYFFFKPASDVDQVENHLKRPSKIARHGLHGIIDHQHIAGIYSSYAGYVTISDSSGEVNFPRKHRENKATIIVTENIEPVIVAGNTVDHWRLLENAPAQRYVLNEQFDEKKNQYVWLVEKQDLPHDNKISTDTIVIFAKPKNIEIPLESVITHKSANLVLPSIYVKKGIDVLSNGMNMLAIRHLFKALQEKNSTKALHVSTYLLP